MTNMMKSGHKGEVGRPTGIDIARAVLDPASEFRHPDDVATCEGLSAAMRRRLLQLWEADVRGQMREEDEGGPVRTTRAGVLEEIRSAMATLPGGARTAADRGTRGQ